MAELPLDKVLDFLRKVQPFSGLPQPVLKAAAAGLMIDYFPEGETILFAGPVHDPFLYLVFSGVACCFTETPSGSIPLRYVSEADHFGSETILTGKSPYSVKVQEDAICYLVKPSVFKDLETNSDDFGLYFRTLYAPLADQVSGYMERQWETAPYRALWDKSSSSQFKTPIRALMGREPVCCRPRTAVSEIARIMEFTGVGSVVVMEHETPVGIVTKNDLTWKVLARKRGNDVPAFEIMSTRLLTMDLNASCFEASLRMVENRCHHMLVVGEGKLRGVVSQHDLILLQGANPVAVVGGVDKQTDLAGLKTCVDHMSVVQQGLLVQGGTMLEIWTLMSSFRDALTQRLMVLAIETMRKQGKEPPVLEFCWMTFGTPGRGETLLSANFLEGFIYRDPKKGQEDESGAYAAALAAMVKEGLVACGLLDRREGQVLRVSESEWKKLFMFLADRKTGLKGDHLRVFDFRGVGEEHDLVQAFRDHVLRMVRKSPDLLGRMRAANDPSRIPDCFYRDQVVTGAERRERLNLKQEVLTPLVSAVRLLSLERGITAVGTKDRIEALAQDGAIRREQADNLQAIHPWLVETCLHRALSEGKPPDWVLEVRQCSSEEKRLLTESFKIIKETVRAAS